VDVRNVEGFKGPLTVLQFKGGQSNPTYRLNTPGRSYVTRCRPLKLLPSAHAVDREFRVISARKEGFPGRALRLVHGRCRDGSAFYIMSMEEGRCSGIRAASQLLDARRKIFASKIETLAKLHLQPGSDRSRRLR
jgi:aminoglycoside phosphotransferase (APT) family kinase protein